MKKSVRHLIMAHLLLASSAAIASCGSQAASEGEGEVARLAAELRGELELPEGFLALEEDEPDPPSECDCGPLIPWPPPECARVNWFCNAVGQCACAQPAAPELAAVSTTFTAESTLSARVVTNGADVSDVPLRYDGEDPECKCLGATVSPPQGGCALEDWYCNASGLCRCRS